MGMIILPIYIGALIIFILSLLRVIPIIKGNELSGLTLSLGLAIPVLLLSVVVLNWIMKGKLHHYTLIFQLPFYLVFLPAIIYLGLKLFLSTETLVLVRPVVMVALVTGGLLVIPGLMYLTDFLKKMGVKFFY